MDDDVHHAWKLFSITLLQKVSLKWHNRMKMLNAGNCKDSFYDLVTISDEAFVLHVLSWYIPLRETATTLEGKKKPGRKKLDSVDDKKKLQNYAQFYECVKAARSHENKTEWEEAIFEELKENDSDDGESMFTTKDSRLGNTQDHSLLPFEPMDLKAWDTV